ncbi:cytochrome bd oxidase small subunit CydS [Compostibacillus humi]
MLNDFLMFIAPFVVIFAAILLAFLAAFRSDSIS